MKERILITGAAGFVGANLVRRLLKEDNYEVHILTRESSNMWRLKDIYDKVIDHKVDILDKNKLSEVIHQINPKKICHLAIYGGYPSQREDEKIINTNLIGTINLLEALKDIDYNCFINTGSSSEYGKKEKKMKETDICEPNTIYGVAKSASAMYCNYVAMAENKNIGTLRLFSVFGDYEEKGRLITTLYTNMLNNKNVKLGNPKAVRDFVYVGDVVEAYLKVLENPEKLKGEIFNICSGKQLSVGEIAEMVKKELNSSNNLEFSNEMGRSFDTTIWLGDGIKIFETYNWKPRNIEVGIKKSSQWFKENILLYKEN